MNRLRFRHAVPGTVPAEGAHVLTWRGTAVMGVLNVTPDSFSDGGRHADPERALEVGLRMIDEGALVVDVGGESTRPGAERVPTGEEIRRVVPVVERLGRSGRALVSIDTRNAVVADAALAAGAHLVNDVGGLRDPAMLDVCARHGAPAVAMHMQGEPATMQRAPRYDDVVRDVRAFLEAAARRALERGVPSVMLDPGLGFGKTLEHNLALLRGLEAVVSLGHPVLVGASRKRMIDTLAGVPEPAARGPGSVALHLFAASRGAAMVRAHDVAMHVQALRVWNAVGLDAAPARSSA